MPQTLDEPVRLDCQISGEAVQIFRDGEPCPENRLPLPSQALVEIADFEHDERLCRVNAFTLERDGTLTPWPRNGADDGCVSLAPGEGARKIDVLVVPVAYAWVGALSDDDLDAFDEHVYAPSRVIVEVPDPKDERPGGMTAPEAGAARRSEPLSRLHPGLAIAYTRAGTL
jgi:hypothetical protein